MAVVVVDVAVAVLGNAAVAVANAVVVVFGRCCEAANSASFLRCVIANFARGSLEVDFFSSRGRR